MFAAAGGTGLGVYQAAADTGNLAIGVDSNQNHLHPGTMLTSMLKRVDVAAYEAFRTALDSTWQPGIKALGLAEGGVDIAIDEHNEPLLTEEMKATVEEVRQQIIDGEIYVLDYRLTNACVY